MNEVHAMLDLETLGTRPDAAVVAIGACIFDPYSDKKPEQTFDVAVTIESAMKHGRIDASTLDWWFQQSKDAQDKTFNRFGHTLPDALRQFNWWLLNQCAHKRERLVVWGNGAAFDNVVIRSAHEAAGMTPVWSFRKDMCYRAICAVFGKNIPFERTGCHHNAVDDAISQAVHLQKIYKAVGLMPAFQQDSVQ